MFEILSKSLGTKITFWLSVILVIILTVTTIINIVSESQILLTLERRAVKILADSVLTAMRYPMMLGDQDVIQMQFGKLKEIEGIEFIHVLDHNGIIRRSTEPDLIGKKSEAAGLEKALEGERHTGVEVREGTQHRIYSKLMPVLNESSCYGCHGSEQKVLGVVRGAVDWEPVAKALAASRIRNILISVVSLGIMGVLVFLLLRGILTKPASLLINAATTLASIQKGNFTNRIEVKTKDEIGLLAQAFNEMSSRFNSVIEEVKRLTMFEERNRIALDLHDGFVQDLANIIKRLELYEKLFRINPALASEELENLRENTKDILNKTRQMIYDLKSTEGIELDLLSKLTSYIKDYERANNITVKLQISGPIDNIAPLKAKDIFYILLEAFTNIRKHSQAKNVELYLEVDGNDNLTINIQDDGKGFDIKDIELLAAKNGKLGLTSMHQRATSLGGTLVIESQPQKGTKISLSVPLKEKT